MSGRSVARYYDPRFGRFLQQDPLPDVVEQARQRAVAAFTYEALSAAPAGWASPEFEARDTKFDELVNAGSIHNRIRAFDWAREEIAPAESTGSRVGNQAGRSARKETVKRGASPFTGYARGSSALTDLTPTITVQPSAQISGSDPSVWNLYPYVANNPLTRTDPDGRQVSVGVANPGGAATWAKAADKKVKELQQALKQAGEQALKGEAYEGEPTTLGTIAEILSGFIPILGQGGDTRDTTVAVKNLLKDPTSGHAWGGVGAAAAGWVGLDFLKGPLRQIRRAAQETAETALKEGAEKALRQGPLTAENLEKLAPNRIAENSLVGRVLGKLNQYPQVLDPRTGRTIQFPSGIEKVVPQAQRVSWGTKERGEFIAEWYRRGYETPRGGWGKYDIHHIKPREFGGTNEFLNLTPVLRGTHQEAFNSFWREFAGL